MDNSHQMVVTNKFPTGAKEWYCPTCGRRFILQMPPHYQRIVMFEGDEQTPHSGGHGGLVIGDAYIVPEDYRDNLDSGNMDEDQGQTNHPDDPYLSPWEHWMRNQDL